MLAIETKKLIISEKAKRKLEKDNRALKNYIVELVNILEDIFKKWNIG